MTRFDAIRRQLADIEKHHERALEKREMQIRLLCGYRDELEAENGRLREQFTVAFRLHLQSADQDLRELLESEAGGVTT